MNILLYIVKKILYGDYFGILIGCNFVVFKNLFFNEKIIDK